MDDGDKKRISSLIINVGKGDEQSLILLYKLTSPRLLSIALALLGNRYDAEDAVSDTFVRVVKYAQSFRRNDNGYGWIATITRNCATDILRLRKNHVNIDDIAGLAAESGITDTAQEVTAALDALDADERAIIALRYYGDLTVRDIAKNTGQARSTVMYKLQRAEEKLRIKLKPPNI